MKLMLTSGTLAFAIAAATPAAAADYVFSAGTVFSGSFSFTDETLTAFSGNLAGRAFTLANVGFVPAPYNTVGGTTGGELVITGNFGGSTSGNDFTFAFDPSAPVTSTLLTYTTPATGIATATLSISPASSAVPEPATWAMMIAGFGVVGYAMRRRKIRFAEQRPA